MEEKISRLKKSNAWDPRFDLPCFPSHLNPWIYLAYSLRVIGWDGDKSKLPLWFVNNMDQFLFKCEKSPGFIQSYPWGLMASHDEVLGAAFIHNDFAERADQFLNLKDGVYSLGDEQIHDFSRFMMVRPAIRALAGLKLSLISQVKISLNILWDAFITKPGECNETLKIWLIAPSLKNYSLCDFALSVWKDRWMKRGFNPKTIFTKYYLVECPIMGELAREDFE